MKRASGWLKRIGIVVGALALVFVILAVTIPLFVDVDKYRPQIVEMANQHINGKLELGKLKLSLWGQIRVEVAGVKLSDVKGREVVSVNDAYFHVPFAPILTGSPVLTFKMKKPEINVVKDASGRMNVMTLMKEQAGGGVQAKAAPAPQQSPTTAPAEPKGGTGVALPGIATRARFGLELRDAGLTYRDEKTGLSTKLTDLNLVLRDLSLSRATSLEAWADLNTSLAQANKPNAAPITVRGPIKFTGKGKPDISDGKFNEMVLQLKGDFDGLEIVVPPELFHKKKGIPANVEGQIRLTEQQATIEQLLFKFFNAEVKTSGTISQLQATGGKPAVPVVNINVKSNDVQLGPWVELIPMLKEYQLGGIATLEAGATGPSEKLNYHAAIALKGVTAKAPKLKSQPKIEGVLNIVTDRVENMALTVKAPGNDLRFQGKVISFTAPRAEMSITSSGLDLDQLIELPPLGQKKVKPSPIPAAAGGAGVGGAGGKTVALGPDGLPLPDYDALLAPMRENPVARAASANLTVNIASMKVYNVKMTDIRSKLFFRDLVGAIESFSMNLWGGTVKANAAVQLKHKTPPYRFGGEVANLDLQQAVTSQLGFLKDTVLGKASFKAEGQGLSLNPEAAKTNLIMKGNMKVEKASFATIDVGRMASEAVNKAIEKIGEKIPQAKGRSLKTAAGRESRYEYISSDFNISQGKFTAPNFVAKAEPNQGIDLKGDTTVGIVDYSIKASWQLIDTYNFTHARDISIEQAGVSIPHLLAEGDQPVKFPVHVGCTLLQPCYSYTEVPEALAKVALANVTRGVEGKAKAELQKRAEEKMKELQKKAPPKVQDAVKGFGKKLFGR